MTGNWPEVDQYSQISSGNFKFYKPCMFSSKVKSSLSIKSSCEQFLKFFSVGIFSQYYSWNFFPNQLNLNSLHDWVFHQNNSSCTQWHSPRLISLLSSLLLWCWVDSLVSTFRLDAVRLDYDSSVLIGLIDFTIFIKVFRWALEFRFWSFSNEVDQSL